MSLRNLCGKTSVQHGPAPPHSDRAGERGGTFGVSELQPPGDKAHVGVALNVLLPPSGIGSRREQTDDQCAAFRFAPCLGDPFDDLPAIRRIHPTAFTSPGDGKAVGFRHDVAGAFRVAGLRADVERKEKTRVQSVKQPLRRCPFGRCGREQGRIHKITMSP